MPSFFQSPVFQQAVNRATGGGLTLGTGGLSAVTNAASGINTGGELLQNLVGAGRGAATAAFAGSGGAGSSFGGGSDLNGPYDRVDDVIVVGDRGAPRSSDMRVSLRAQGGQAQAVYGEAGDDNILSILHKTGGVIFPYTPTISVEQAVDYKSVELVHSNNDINTYTRTPSVSLSVTGKFSIQNQREGLYAIAVVHFLRTVSKMHFGENDPNAGLPPPVLLFRGYGKYMFNDLKVVLKNHSYSLDDTVDYIDIITDSEGSKTRLPSLFTISLTLGYQQTPNAMRKDFDLNQFRTGELMRSQKGWI